MRRHPSSMISDAESAQGESETDSRQGLSLPERIRQAYSQLSRGQQQVARFILDQPAEMAFLTSAQLGHQVGVSEATVIRFAMRLGFDGYPEMQQIVREVVRSSLDRSASPATSGQTERTDASLFYQVMNAERQNLEATIAGMSSSSLTAAVQLLAEARQIYVVGGHTSYALAHLARVLINQVTRKAQLVNMSPDALADQMVALNADDVLLTFATPRYTRQTIEVFRYARRQGARCISVTDSLLSLAADGADVVLPVHYVVPSFFNGNVAAVAIAEALAAGLADFRGGDSSSYLEELEASYHRWGNPLLNSDAIVDEDH